MKFVIKDKKLSVIYENENIEQPNSGSINDYEVEVEFDSEWDNLTKVAKICIEKEDIGIERAVIDNKLYIDMNKYQRYAIGFIGYSINYRLTEDITIVQGKKYYTRELEEGEYVYTEVTTPVVEELNTYYEQYKDLQKSTNLVVVSYKKGAGEIEIQGESEIPTPTEWEIYLQQIQMFINNANEILDEANTLDVDADGEILTITKKDGTTKQVNIKGEKGDQRNSRNSRNSAEFKEYRVYKG